MKISSPEISHKSDVDGVKVGHATDETARTGCTVVLFEEGACAGVDIGGSAILVRLAGEIVLLNCLSLKPSCRLTILL